MPVPRYPAIPLLQNRVPQAPALPNNANHAPPLSSRQGLPWSRGGSPQSFSSQPPGAFREAALFPSFSEPGGILACE